MDTICNSVAHNVQHNVAVCVLAFSSINKQTYTANYHCTSHPWDHNLVSIINRESPQKQELFSGILIHKDFNSCSEVSARQELTV